MIKLVLSDMDGTLLNSNKELPKDTNEVFRKLIEKGIYCGIATGRSQPSLARDFTELEKELTFICENGAVVYHKGKLLYKNVIDPKLVGHVLDEAIKLSDVHIVLAALHKTYMLPCSDEKKIMFEMYYPNIEFVEDIFGVEEEIVKISIYDDIGSEDNSYPALKMFQDILSVAPSAHEWTDVSTKGVGKGIGMNVLQEQLNLDKSECMAFGDFLNDLTLLQEVEYSYAVANAHPEVKKISNYECDSNDNQGVIKTIRDVFEI